MLVACSSPQNGPVFVIKGSSGATSSGGSAGSGGAPSGDGSGALAAPLACTASCCPTDPTCYSDPSKGSNAPGAECLATRDNTGQQHIQMRQAWIHPIAPPGNAKAPIIYEALSQLSDLPYAPTAAGLTCGQGAGLNSGQGAGGYIQLIDFFLNGGSDISHDYATVGFSTLIGVDGSTATTNTLTTALTDGLCMATLDYTEPTDQMVNHQPYTQFALKPSQMGSTSGWPPVLVSLEPPMPLEDENGAPLSWKVAPAKEKRLAQDFGDPTDPAVRATLLDMFDSTSSAYVNKNSEGFSGVFFYDPVTGHSHGWALMSFLLIYSVNGNKAPTYIVVPIREAELESTFNDPDHPDCSGYYDPTEASGTPALPPATCNIDGLDVNHAAWGGGDCSPFTDSMPPGTTPCAPGQGPTRIKGYFLSTELEQIYNGLLNSTLCVSYQDPDKRNPDGSGDFINLANHSCLTAKWDPSLQDDAGLPPGDWCAATNQAATSTCHDAWRSISYHVFSGAKIKLAADGTPATCSVPPQ